jgi:glycine/D-amino acid oxidase-like deaminating enzyme
VASSPAAGAVICGAGIAGVSTAYFLTVVQGMSDVVLCDPLPPLTLTSDKSTECYRNWWPEASMVSFMDRSIDLLEKLSEQSGDAFNLSRRGYLYVTGEEPEAMVMAAEQIAEAGAGAVRVHTGTDTDPPYASLQPEGWATAPGGADVFAGSAGLTKHFPLLSTSAAGATHVRRAGWFSAQQLGAWMLDQATAHGLIRRRSRVVGVDHDTGRVTAVWLDDGTRIATEAFINASGPMLGEVGMMVGADLPVHNEVHLKVAFKDTLGAIPRDAPMLIWADPQRLDLTDEERTLCRQSGRTDLLGTMPAGCHCRPEGGLESEWVLGLWEYHRDVREPSWPLPVDPLYAETVLRGLTTMIPAVSGYLDSPPESVVDGGYYTKTTDNLPLIGPAGPEASFVCGGLSGYGVMAACAAGELAAIHATGAPLPGYAAAFDPARYDDPAYVEKAAVAAETGQI